MGASVWKVGPTQQKIVRRIDDPTRQQYLATDSEIEEE